MLRLRFALLHMASLGLVVWCDSAWAQAPGSTRQNSSDATEPAVGVPPPLFTAVDADINGLVTRSEFDAYRTELFRELDTDRNNLIGPDEWRQPHGARTLRSPSLEEPAGSAGRQAWLAHYRHADTDRDGAISGGEWSAQSDALFMAYDRNGDGRLEPGEMLSRR